MKYRICYECRSDGVVFLGDFEIDSLVVPIRTDQLLVERALTDSSKFHRTGLGGIEIVSIAPVD